MSTQATAAAGRRALMIGGRISARRNEIGLTQKDVAERAGISPAYLSLIENDKRAIGGLRLRRLADALDMEIDSLSGASETRVAEELMGVLTDALFERDPPDAESVRRLAARDPGLAGAFLTLYRAYLAERDQAAALSNRLSQDPVLLELSHQILNRITAMRSVSQILVDVEDIPTERERQFRHALADEGAGLVEAVRGLLDVLASGTATERAANPADEVDDLIIDHGDYFPTLETAASRIRLTFGSGVRQMEHALAGALFDRYGIAVEFDSRLLPDGSPAHFDAAARRLTLFDGMPDPSIRFQLARVVARLECEDELEEIARDARLTTETARNRAKGALERYLAAAILFPYEEFLASAVELRYDIERLSRRFGGSFEQIAHRLVSLKAPGAAGIPFAFMRVDAAGNVSKRFSLPNLRLPRYREACAYWAAFEAFATPDRIVTQHADMPNGTSFLMIARVVTRPAPGYGIPTGRFSVMLACDAIWRDGIVYGDALAANRSSIGVPVGVTCRLCQRTSCPQRAHTPIVPPAGRVST